MGISGISAQERLTFSIADFDTDPFDLSAKDAKYEKFDDQKIFAINIRQEYNSSTYADDGYLFLLVDMTDTEAPLIKVRTWQPNEVAIEKLYNAGDFFND